MSKEDIKSKKDNLENYIDAIRQIKNAILQSRYTAAALVNRELLALYFCVGEYVSSNTRTRNWGSGTIEIISDRLQQELPGLRGFSSSNIKNMRLFYEAWKDYLLNRQVTTGDLKKRETASSSRQFVDS